MLRIDYIHVKTEGQDKVSLSRIQEIIEGKLHEVASATKFRVIQNSERLEVILKAPISLQTANKIFNTFSREGIEVKELNWKEEGIGPFDRGTLELTVS